MTKIIMRAPSSPLEPPGYFQASLSNSIGTNTGNLVFASSVARTLMLEDVDIDFVNTHKSFSDKEAARIDERYDCFVIPLANAFRSNFMEELDWLTALVRRLSIPCIVVGVGYQGKIGSKKFGRKWDEKARAFMDAILEKSALVGIRGETTARYLESIGFEREHDRKSLPELLEGVDFCSILEGHEQRFAHYLEFLHINGLETIFDHELSSVPFDEKVDSLDWGEPLEPLHLSSGLRRRVDAALIRWGFRMKAALEK